MVVKNKSENYKLYDAGMYGNKFRTWNSLSEIVASNYTGKVVMRYKGTGGGAQYCAYGQQVEILEVYGLMAIWVNDGAEIDKIVFNEAAPDDTLVIQGEVTRTEEGLSLFYSDAKTTMRKAMQVGLQLKGLIALQTLQHALFPGSYDDLMVLLEIYPDSVIEFSAYDHALGCIPHRNTVVWEVRNY